MSRESLEGFLFLCSKVPVFESVEPIETEVYDVIEGEVLSEEEEL